MKNQTIILSLFLLSLVIGLAGCDHDILDNTPLTEISENDIWNDPALVEAYVNARYNHVGHGWTETMESSVVDETAHTASRGCEPINQGYVSASDLGRMNGAWYGWDYRAWSTEWEQIANCNIFFERIGQVPFEDESYRNQMIGEVRFIRVLTYWDLIRRWGGLPIITKSFTINDQEEILNQTRASYKDCIDFLIGQLDSAVTELPARYIASGDQGRATSVAALSLKSRILLYAASDLMNEGVTNELIGYLDPASDRWAKAAKAAQEAIELALDNGYVLYDKYGDDVKTKYRQLFLEPLNSEIIFSRQGTASSEGENLSYMDQVNGPNGYGGWGGACPLQEFVDAFEMADGTEFDWNNEDEAANPFENRDGRFYACVLYDGAPWHGRNVETFYATELAANGDTTVLGEGNGKDTKYGNDSWNTSVTGYYLGKYVDESYVYNSWNFANPKDWIWLRLGEQYLNLAEALCETGDEVGAREAVNVIRDRARMPRIGSDVTGADLLQRIRNERRVELCFEEHRYCDVRRWKLGEEYLDQTVHGIDIYKWTDGTKTYLPGNKVVEHRKFYGRMYWLPIPQTEIDKNPNIVQNPGYN